MVGVEHRFAGGRHCGQPGGVRGFCGSGLGSARVCPRTSALEAALLEGPPVPGTDFPARDGFRASLRRGAPPGEDLHRGVWRSCFPVLEVMRACAVGRRGSTVGGTSTRPCKLLRSEGSPVDASLSSSSSIVSSVTIIIHQCAILRFSTCCDGSSSCRVSAKLRTFIEVLSAT